MKVPLPSIFLVLFLISNLVTTTTIVVIATEIQAEDNGIVNDIGESESETLVEQPERQALHSPEETEIETNTINNTSEDANSVGNEDDSAISEDTSNESPDSSLPGSDEIEAGNSSDESTTEDVIENEMEETTITESLDDNELVEAENTTLMSSEGETADEMSETDVAEIDTVTTPETDQDEDEIPSTSTAESTSSESVSEDDIESVEPIIEDQEPASAETATEAEVESTQEEEDVQGESEEKAYDEEAQDETKTVDDDDDDDDKSETNESESIPPPDDSKTEDDSHIDLDDLSEQVEASDSLEETEKGDESDGNEDEDNQVDAEVTDKARARAQAREDRLKPKTANTTTSSEEVETAENSTAEYRGEPWGQYRSFRRLPDLDLLRLVFDNSNKIREKSNGDAESQRVVNDWEKDPLYDETLAKDSESGEPYLGDDPKFREYREKLLDGAAGDNETTKLSSGNENATEGEQDTNDADANNNNADVNSEFGDGLDDIDKFFEGVNPPDELDVGYGSSIQDVLMDKGKDILLKKIRGFAHWIKIGWKTMGRKLEERISEFQLPFQNTSSTASESETKSLSTKEQREELVENTKDALATVWKFGKRTMEVISDLVDGLLDRFDDKGEDESANFEDFGGFDLDDLSSFKPPV